MGDLRNKLTKELRDEAHRRLLEKLHPTPMPPALPRCLCGLTYYDVPVMWQGPSGRHEPARFYCPACIPPGLMDT